jgi:RNA polymerase sigma-70 factor (ECF subfamily)
MPSDLLVDVVGRDPPGHGSAALRMVIPSIDQIYEAHIGYVHRCLTRLGVRPDLVEDASHDVFVVVHQKLAGFDGNVPLTTWLYAIALRVARRYRERQAKAHAQQHGAEVVSASASPEADAQARGALELARRALETLDDVKREVFVLADVEQLSAPEIAEITGAPLPTVYTRLRAAREAFASAVRRLERPRGPR